MKPAEFRSVASIVHASFELQRFGAIGAAWVGGLMTDSLVYKDKLTVDMNVCLYFDPFQHCFGSFMRLLTGPQLCPTKMKQSRSLCCYLIVCTRFNSIKFAEDEVVVRHVRSKTKDPLCCFAERWHRQQHRQPL